MYYLGIDGGGTKTRYMIANEQLEIVADVTGPTIHIHQIGQEVLKQRLQETILETCKQANIALSELKFAFLGVPGYGESEADKIIINSIVADVLEGIAYRVDNDGVVGWAAGCGCLPGINLVAGTGTIAFGCNEKHEILRCGGWGPFIGDDASATAIGIKTINEYTKQKDGRLPQTQLVEVLEREYQIEYDFEIVDIVFNRLKLDRPELAKFAKVTSLAAEAGCEAAKRIFNEAAHDLALHVVALAKDLGLKEGFSVSYTGGVFQAGHLILDPLAQHLKPLNVKLQAPLLEPAKGAVLLAYQLGGHEISLQEINQLNQA